MKVYVFPADRDGCGHYRMIWPSQVLAAQGHNVVVRMPNERHELRAEVRKSDNSVSDAFVPDDADVVVLQRVTHRLVAESIPIIRRKYGCAVVLDLDDDLSRIHPANAAFTMMHPRYGATDHSWHNTVAAAQAATLVTVSTPALLRRYAPASVGNGVVLPNYVPEAFLRVDHYDSKIFGWPGAIHSHPDDLQVVGSAVARLVREGRLFKVIGPGDGVREALGLDAEPVAAGVVPMELWSEAIAQLGVGVAPLADTQFNAGKSWLKGLELAAVGVPCVMSPRDEYRSLHKLGVGLLAERPKDWYRELKRLLDNPGLRETLGERGRAVATELTVEGNAWRWLEAWTEASRREHSVRQKFLTSRPTDYALRASPSSPSNG